MNEQQLSTNNVLLPNTYHDGIYIRPTYSFIENDMWIINFTDKYGVIFLTQDKTTFIWV